MFSGSYHPEDVVFLLRLVDIDSTPVAEKERLIQSGRRHYSEMISFERLPSREYLELFHRATDQNRIRFARDLIGLAQGIARMRPGPVTVVSLARAGTPIGALVCRILRRRLERPVAHYSISIIRDRGIDGVALDFILERHRPETLLFVDGWTGKGVIARELRASVEAYNKETGLALDPGLYTVADLCGAAAGAATDEDYLIPSSILGATISGLVSRSILNDAVVGPGDFHGCRYYREFEPHDLSRWFVETITEEIERQWAHGPGQPHWVDAPRSAILRQASERFLEDVRCQYGVRDPNHVKPGIGEATRVLLRRVPDRVLVRDADSPSVAHLLLLAKEKGVPVVSTPGLQYNAAAIIKDVGAS